MGAWGTGQFDNDTAADWIATFSEDQKIEALQDALDAVLNEDEDEIDQDDASGALAACEVIAGINGNVSATFPKQYIDAVAAKDFEFPIQQIDFAKLKDDNFEDLRQMAWAVTRIIRDSENSELRNLWEEGGEFENWKKEIGDLEKRLEEK